MRSVFELATPRDEVLLGELSEEMFAARLKDVMDDSAEPGYTYCQRHRGARTDAISSGSRQMPAEEACYWYSKCTVTETAERAQKALRVLLAAD